MLSQFSPIKATLGGVLACLIWSLAILVMNRITVAFGVFYGAGFELAISGIILTLFFWKRGILFKICLHNAQALFICGTFWFFNVTACWLAVGLAKNSGELLVVGILNYLWPSLTLLFGVLFRHAQANVWWFSFGLVSVSAGVIAVKFSSWIDSSASITQGSFIQVNMVAYTLAVIDAVAWALYSNLSRKLLNPEGISPVPLYMLVTSLPLLLIASGLEPLPSFVPNDISLLVMWAILAATAYLFWDMGMRYGNIVAISIVSMFIPLFSTLVTAILSRHTLSFTLIFGAILVVFGSMLCSRSIRRQL